MSTEHLGGTAQPEAGGGSFGPQEESSSAARHGVEGPAPDAAKAEQQPPVVESAPTLALGKLGADEEPPAAPRAPEYADAPPPAAPSPSPSSSAHESYGEAPPPPPYAGNPYAAPQPPYPSAEPPYPSAESQHPFGAGQPLGGWGASPYPDEPGVPTAASRPKKGGFIALVAAVALVAGLAGGAIGAGLSGGSSNSSGTGTARTSTTVTVGDNQKTLDRAPDSVAGIAAKALPSTVTIKAQNSSEAGTGTGFVFDTEGHILTNNHVVAPALNGGKLTVKFSDGTTYPASVVGHAQGYDVAVVKLDTVPTGKLVPLPLGDSDKVAVGDAAIAIGAPYGLESTVTSGIISAKNRPVASGDETTGAQQSYMNALQTDAPINPGNSGGPLLSASGAVIGINSAIQSNAGANGRAGSIGLGFAIPINQAKWVAQQLIANGTPVYAILGVLRNDDYKGDGAQIQTAAVNGTPAVTPGGPADAAGLKPGDVITKLGGVPIDSGPTLVSEIWSHQPGEKVDVEYTRNNQPAKTTVTLGSRKGDS